MTNNDKFQVYCPISWDSYWKLDKPRFSWQANVEKCKPYGCWSLVYFKCLSNIQKKKTAKAWTGELANHSGKKHFLKQVILERVVTSAKIAHSISRSDLEIGSVTSSSKHNLESEIPNPEICRIS